MTAFETEEDPTAISEEAVRITPETDRLARARVLSAHAHVLAMFWRHKALVVLGLAIGLVLGALYYSRQPPVFQSSASAEE